MKKETSELGHSEQRYRFLADSVPQIIWTAKPDGILDYYNQRWFDYSGVNFEQMEKLGWTFFVHSEDLPSSVATWQKALATGCSYEVEFRLRRGSDGAYRWHLGRAFPMKDEKGEIIQWVGTCTDIDDQLRANELLEKTVAERTARLQELVEELQAFAYSISHDLRAPLRVMKGFSNILKEEYGAQLDEKANGYLDRISLSSHRMSELIKDVLNYSTMSLTDLVIVPIHPGNLIAEIVSTYPNLGSSEIDISIAETFPLVLANESALNQCVSNILSNAMKFVEAGVKPHVKVWGEQNAGMIRLWFKDNGIGIAREDFERVFDIFHRVNGTREGTGIGLAIVKQAVERMGGNVGLESELGRGTSFWLELPSAPP